MEVDEDEQVVDEGVGSTKTILAPLALFFVGLVVPHRMCSTRGLMALATDSPLIDPFELTPRGLVGLRTFVSG